MIFVLQDLNKETHAKILGSRFSGYVRLDILRLLPLVIKGTIPNAYRFVNLHGEQREFAVIGAVKVIQLVEQLCRV